MRTHPPLQRRRPLRLLTREPVLIGLAAVAAILVAVVVTAPPPTVRELTMRNDTAWHLDVEVGDGSGDGWSPLPIALAGSTSTVADVLDQGDRWVFVVRSGGEDAGRIQMTRAQLRAAGWTVVVPDGVGRRLEEAGVAVPPG